MVPLKPFAVPYVVVPRECRVQFPKPCFKGLKWGRWDCNVRGGATESSVIRIACDLWVVRRVDRTPVFGRRPKDAAYHTWGHLACARKACCVAGRGCGGVRVGSRAGLLSGKRTSERDISTDSIQQAEIAFSAQRSGQRLYKSLAASVGVLWRCPTLPQPIGCSTIGAAGLSFQVRNVAGRFPGAVTTTRLFVQHHPPALFVWLGGVG